MKKSIFLVNLMVLPTFAMNTPNSDELSQPQSAKYVSLNDNLEDDGLNLCLVEEDILNPENSAQNLSDVQALLLDALLDNLKLVATDVGLRGAGTILRGVGGLAQVAGTKFTGARCLVPYCREKEYKLECKEKEALWDRYYMVAPGRQRRCVEKYKIVKRA